MPATVRRLASLAIAAALLAGCGGSSASGDAPADQGNRGVPPGIAQSNAEHASPQAVALAFWAHVGKGEYDAACRLFTPDYQQQAGAYGGCVPALQKEWPAKQRALITEPVVETAQIELDGDTAKIPSEAIHNKGKKPWGEINDEQTGTSDLYVPTVTDQPRYDETKCVRIGGLWWVDPDTF